jgi:predicted ArsR family transcriptional regulator
MFQQYPLVIEMNVRVQRGVRILPRLVRALGEPTRRKVYLMVEAAGRPVTRLDVAEAVGITGRLAGFHLDKLADEGLLDIHHARPADRPGGPGAGRPAKWYRLSGVQFDLTIPPRRTDIAARVMALALDELGPEGAHRGALLEQGHACGQALARARTDLLTQLTDLGYQPAARTDGTLELRNCPFHPIVQVAPDTACTMNQALLTGLTDSHQGPRYEAVLERAETRCCVLLRPL